MWEKVNADARQTMLTFVYYHPFSVFAMSTGIFTYEKSTGLPCFTVLNNGTRSRRASGRPGMRRPYGAFVGLGVGVGTSVSSTL